MYIVTVHEGRGLAKTAKEWREQGQKYWTAKSTDINNG